MDPRPAAPPLAAVPRPAPTGGVLIFNWRDTTHPEGGGSEVYIERIAAGLAAAGRPVTLFCAAHPGAPATERIGGTRVVRRGGRRTVYLHAWWAHLSGRLGPHEVVVDVQNGLPFFSALWCRRPLVVLVHHVHREQWRVVLPALQARLGWWVESRLAPSLYRRARYVAVSDATRRELVGLGVAAAAISVVHNGMALPDPGAAVPRTPHPSVCVLGRLVPHKRVELALEAAARIRRHLPGLRVVVVGQGWWEPRLREAVARLGLADAVELVGWVDEATKQRLLASSWVHAMPSVKEGWGLAVLEAAANGTPTVAFRAAGGLGESVLHGTTGLLADDVDEFTRHLAWVLLNRHLRERLGEAARANAARYTWPQAVAAFAAVLDQATAPGRDGVIIDGMDGARIDRWLWAVRLVKTRSLAAQACRAGHVQINGARAKPAATVRVGDTVRARLGSRERVVEVARLLDTRVGAEVAASCLIDRSPPPPPRDPLAGFGARHPGAGRPTKLQRRQLDRARGRPPR